MTIWQTTTQSPIGALQILSTSEGLCAVIFGDRIDVTSRQVERRFGALPDLEEGDPHGAVAGLDRYFAGELAALDMLPVDAGGTPFQQRVWAALRKIEVGTTVSYSHIARDIGHETAVRAVGAANGQNPVAIVVPCHRVIGSNGTLTGYAGGIDRKRWLLEHERYAKPFGLAVSRSALS